MFLSVLEVGSLVIWEPARSFPGGDGEGLPWLADSKLLHAVSWSPRAVERAGEPLLTEEHPRSLLMKALIPA